MAKTGQVIEHPITGEIITFLKTAQDTQGALLQMDFVCKPHRARLVPHLHDVQEERFEVISGRLAVRIGGPNDVRVLLPGQSVVVPPRAVHAWWNDGDEDMHCILEMRPALKNEIAFEATFGLARDGKVNNQGIPKNIWELALLADLSKSYFPGVPVALQKVLFKGFAGLAKWRGYAPDFPQYSESVVASA
jgi:quercetin dioxygenase-like cupin family protein